MSLNANPGTDPAQLKILLLQIREDDVTIQEELEEFVKLSGLKKSQFTLLNTFDTPDFEANMIDDYDALFVGGSSDATVMSPEKYPFVQNCKNMMRYCYDNDIPVFASCFGFQVVIEEFGGKIIRDQHNMEMGIHDIELTPHAADDILFHDSPKMFPAVSGHRERASEVSDDMILLGYSEACPYHIIKLDGKPFYAFQFHPEVDREDLIKRITRYQEIYLDDDESLQLIIESATRDTPESNSLVRKFVERILLTPSF